MRKTYRISLLLTCILFATLFTLSICSSSQEPAIQSETGLENGVTIVSVKNDWDYQIITARVPYIGIERDDKTGLARLVIPMKELKKKHKLPMFCHVHYEKDVSGAKKWAKKGWIVSTAVYTPPNGESPIDAALGNGYNLARAIIQWVKRLPIVDTTHILIDGGSQGGYMALAMSADLFPVIATHADVPVVNWAYNFAYFEANREGAGVGLPLDQAPMPVLSSVIGLADMCYKYFPRDLNHECWYYLSPISYLSLITNFTLITCATGDMLVPIEQMTRDYIRQPDYSQFPQGFTRDFDKLEFCSQAKKVFEELIPKDNYEIFLLTPQENSYEITRGMIVNSKLKPKVGPKKVDKPWSKTKHWSLVYLDEGPPTPVAGHTKLEWSLSPDSFVDYHKTAPLPENILTSEKLEHLLRRYMGEIEHPVMLNNNKLSQRLNYTNLEQMDVSISLLSYAKISPKHEQKLQELYTQSTLKPFGPSISASSLEKMYEIPK
ncbi:MAG: hypothetical protein LDL53_12670 [Candidatus Hydrogenedens sp.]|nr:hypothetical protein [Candidatus Hydrogenedens sp.]